MQVKCFHLDGQVGGHSVDQVGSRKKLVWAVSQKSVRYLVVVLLTVYRYAEYRFVLVEKNEIRKEYLGTGF